MQSLNYFSDNTSLGQGHLWSDITDDLTLTARSKFAALASETVFHAEFSVLRMRLPYVHQN